MAGRSGTKSSALTPHDLIEIAWAGHLAASGVARELRVKNKLLVTQVARSVGASSVSNLVAVEQGHWPLPRVPWGLRYAAFLRELVGLDS